MTGNIARNKKTMNVSEIPKPALYGAAGAIGIGFAAYVFGFIFIHGSAPRDDKLSKWINEVCAPTGLGKTVLTWGYTKATWRRFYRYYGALMMKKAKLGEKALDADLVTLNNETKSLLNDYINVMPKGMPLILNMGSYT